MFLKKEYSNVMEVFDDNSEKYLHYKKKDLAYVFDFSFNSFEEIDDVGNNILNEAKLLYDCGFRHFLLHIETPLFFANEADCLFAVSSLQRVLAEIRYQLPKIVTFGLSITNISDELLLSLIKNCSLDYLYCDHLIGQYMSESGIINGNCQKLKSLMNRFGLNFPLAYQLSSEKIIINDGYDLLQHCALSLTSQNVTAIVLGEAKIENAAKDVSLLRRQFPQTSFYYSGEINLLSLRRVLESFDGIFISGSSKNMLSLDGKLQRSQIQQFISQYKQIAGD